VSLLVTNGTAILADRLLEDAAVLCRDGRIEAVGPRSEIAGGGGQVVDAEGGYIAPGFVDIHVHGGHGADFMDGAVEAVRTATRAHARHGTTSLFPTTTTGSPGQLERMLEACREARDSWRPEHGARVAAVHLYGPFFAAEKVGCHSLAGRRDPDPKEYHGYLETGLVGIATSAAELPGAEAYYREAARRGCLVTCGHSNASYGEMSRAFEAGVRHVDHFWCAMSSIPSVTERLGRPMQGSMAEFVLMEPEMSTEVIADGCHLAPELLRFARVMLGPRRLCLVTDSSRALDMPPGRYRFGPVEDGEWFESDGSVGFQGDRLASSVAGMDRMVRTMVDRGGTSIVEAVRMASLTPAERAGIAKEAGSLEPGKRADLLVLTAELTVERVFVGGAEAAVNARSSG
jgi:N-acetylglucosamine-6-phosphate deacetylase